MKLSDECAESMLDAVEHMLNSNGPASVTVLHPITREPLAVVFIIPAPVGVLVDTFLNDLYMMLGWHTEAK